MSTVPIIVSLEQDGTLVRYLPKSRGFSGEVRHLSVRREVYDWLHREDDEALDDTRAEARAHFFDFVDGEEIDDLDFMKRVEDRRKVPPDFSHGVWSISPRFADPQHRYFGLFALKNWVVVLAIERRGNLENLPHLWHSKIDETLGTWNRLFPGREPWVRDYLYEYLSNAEKRDDRW